jgi:hypothetical protein
VGRNWSAKFANQSVTVDATPGQLNVTATAKIDLSAPEVTVKGLKVTTESKDKSWLSEAEHKFYIYTGETGLTKSEQVGIVQAAHGIDIETKGISISTNGHWEATCADIKIAAGLTLETTGTSLKQHIANIWTCAFTKV